MKQHMPLAIQGADRISKMNLPKGLLQRQCACGQHTAGSGGECEECKKKREATLQRAAINPSPVNEVPPIVHGVLRSPGQPLGAATQAFLEPRFRYDFGAEVHAGVKATNLVQSVYNGIGDAQ